MAVRATVVADGTDIMLGGTMDPVSQAVFDRLYQDCAAGVLECREHDDDPACREYRSEDGRVHGAWLYLQKRDNGRKLIACHHPAGPGARLPHHTIHDGMTDQHRWQQDYLCRAAEGAGFTARQEVAIDGTRLDVFVTGPNGSVGIEVQHSHLSVGQVKSRDRKAVKARVPVAWSSDHHADWMTKVPSWRVNVLPDGRRPRGSWRAVSGERTLHPTLCTARNEDVLLGALPHRRGRFCRKWHAVWHPVNNRVVDEIVERFTAGDLVRLDVTGIVDDRRQTIVHLVPALDAYRYTTEFIDQPMTTESLRNPADACHYPNAALALANTSIWEHVQVCPRCQYPTHRLIQYPNGSALGPCCAYPSGMPEEDQEALTRLGRRC